MDLFSEDQCAEVSDHRSSQTYGLDADLRHKLISALAGTRALGGHVGRFQRLRGSSLLTRTEPFDEWVSERRRAGVWPYSRALAGSPSPSAVIADDGGVAFHGLNFASQDYLGLASHEAVRDAVTTALGRYGPHSAGSPALLGNTAESLALERELAEFLKAPAITLFPTGWAAGFATITGLVRETDHVILDERAHACLQQGARAATGHVAQVAHLDIHAAREALRQIRCADPSNGILMVTEGLFSMDSDWPDLLALQGLCREYEATLLVDVAHDLGATGPGGLGAIGRAGALGRLDLVMGSFSKTFASNGGFLASQSVAVKQYVKYFGGPHIFSNALAPIQAAAVRMSLQIIRSAEGEARRQMNARVADEFRRVSAARGYRVLGSTSPILPVVVGSNRIARVAAALLAKSGVLANLVEYPAVPLNSTRFRFQVMATHTAEQASRAAASLSEAVDAAKEVVAAIDASARDTSTGD